MKNYKKFTAKENVSLILRGLKIYSSFPKPVLLSRTVSAIANAIVPFINIYFSARILNKLTGEKKQNELIVLVLAAIGTNLVFMLIKSTLVRWSAYCDNAQWESMRKIFTDKMLSMDFADVEDSEIQKELSEIRQHHNGMGFGLPQVLLNYDGIVTGIIQIILSVAMAFSLFTLKVPTDSRFLYLDSPLAVVIVILTLLCSIFLAPYLSMIGEKIRAKASEYNNMSNRFFWFYFFKMILGSDRAKDIRIYEQKLMITKALSWIDFKNRWKKFFKDDAKFKALSAGVSYFSNGLIYLYAALKSYAGAFGVGGIVQYVGAITLFGGGFSIVLTNVGTLINNNAFLDKTFKFLDIPNKKYQGTLSVEKRDDNEYAIEFCKVSFKYPGSEVYTLKDLSINFNIGQRMAVVGMNGSGKTTMIKLLCRLYDPTEGIITLNGIDIKKYDYDEYMAIFSVVFQDFQLLPFTLGENVAVGVDFDREKVTSVLNKTGFGLRLDNMPDGLDTYLYKNFEERGVVISGGEAQKIALARALYRDAPFIVLDEPTAALDPVAEYEIYSKFNEIIGDKTAIYISHRLSSCRFCDDIAVFHEGRLIERGSHDMLIADEKGKYYELWNAQAQYYKEKAV